MDGYFFLLFGFLLSKVYFNMAPSIELIVYDYERSKNANY
ncbi:hypothetical protein BN3590_01721 [Clostridium sp. C105KSO15]|nr:hypothetical protein BN3590_01721 [Clostridium sp. C105KSO15]